MTFFGFGRNSGGVRPPDDAELERRRRALGERYYGLDRTPTMDATGGVRPPAGLFQNAGEASDYLGYRARRTVGAQPLPIETPTTAATVAEFRGGGVAERPPAAEQSGGQGLAALPGGGAGGMVDGLLRGGAVRTAERPPDFAQGASTGKPAGMFDAGRADRAMEVAGMGPPPAAPVFNLNIGGAAMPPAATAPRMDDLGGAGMPRAERPPTAAAGDGVGDLAPAGPGMEWRRNKRTGEYRQFAVAAGAPLAPAAGAPAGNVPDGEPPVRRIQPRYSAAPAAGAFRDEQIRAGLVQPGAGEDRERELRRQGLVQRAGNTGLSAAARADAREQLAGMEREDAGKNALELGKTRAAATAAQAQAEAAGKSPVFNLPGGKQGVLVGDTLVDAATGALITDARKGGTLDPMLVMQITDPDRRAKLIESWVERGGKVG